MHMWARLSVFAACVVSLASAASTTKGFVTTKGTEFVLDGKPFYYGGTNSYWLQYTQNEADMSLILDKASAAGIKVIRTWGFNDVNATFIPAAQGGLPQYSPDNAMPGQVIFQTWKDGKATLNKGDTGFGHFDKVVALAEQKGIKLIVALTNNWADYGGMDVYTINLGGKYHDEFYYNPKVIKAYKNYVKTVVKRYKKSPAIFAWELANEPRCGADGTRNLPRSPAGCNSTVLTNWIDEMSTYIKDLDKLHLVTIGDEGFFNRPGDTTGDWAYEGNDGVDFTTNLQVKNIDFGTFHLYPDWWSKTVDWANQFIQDHVTAQRAVGKPVILEEYGWMSDAARMQYFGTVSNFSRVEVEGGWQNIVLTEKLSGDMVWQFGLETGLSTGPSSDDGFTIFMENTAQSGPLVLDHVAAMSKLN
ncbi:glycoside hydrolase, partial [Rickenella mellea]